MPPASVAAAPLRVLLVNSIPDGALQRTERQFARLFQTDPAVTLILTTLPEVPRAEWARAHIAEHYIGLDRALTLGADALILTGTEPREPDLRDEPYWQSMTKVMNWAKENAVPAFLSCLAAHAAVLHLDGIRRVRLPAKRFGLFDHDIAADDPLTKGLPRRITVPHSRWNDLPEPLLMAAGYRVLTRSAEAGVDLFIRRGLGSWLFCQGHPEYDPAALWREYQRDVRRYLEHEYAEFPNPPKGFGRPAEIAAIACFRERAIRLRKIDLIEELPEIGIPPENEPSPVNRIVRRWLADIRAATPVGAAAG